MALAARAVEHLVPPVPRSSASAASSPRRSSSRPRAASTSRSPAPSTEADGLATVKALDGDLRRAEGARHAPGSPACLSCSATTPPCASADRPGAGSRRRPRRSWSRRSPRRRRRRAGAPGGRRQQPGRRRRGLPGHRRPGRHLRSDRRRDERDDPPAAVCRSPWPRGSRGTTSSPPAVDAAGPASRRSPASPGSSARPRSRTSAPTARRSPRRSRRSGVWDRTLRGRRAPSPTPTAASPTATAGSRPTPAATSCSTSPSRSQGALGAPGPLRRARARLGVVERRAGAAGATVREAVLALRRGKGMVLDPADHDTWSAGSFFTNPVARRAARPCPTGAPAWPQPDGRVKTSAAWLIERAGFAKRVRRRPGPPLHQAHPRADQPRRRPPPTCSPSRARSATASSRRTASAWSTSRCSSAASSEG